MNKKIIIAIISLLIIGGGIFFIYKNISKEKKKEDEYQDYTPQEEISDEQNRQTKVTLYFENSETGELESEIRLIDANTLIKEPEKEIINFIEVNDLEKEKCLKIAKEVEDNVSLKTKLQDSLLILYKMNDYMELIFMIKSKLKKLKA